MTKYVSTEVLTLSEVANRKYGFNIPCYQRPYVWAEEDVSRFFDDIKNAFEALDEQHYFIGTVLTAKNGAENGFELIDGQQRTTTLMLISLAFKTSGIPCNLAGMAVLDNRPRLQFEIRDSVQHLLGSLAGLSVYTKPGDEAIKADPYLAHIYSALVVLNQKISAIKEKENFDLLGFANYIFTKVHWINNTVPQGMDVNRIFASLNSAGVQLEPVDLLKAKLFKMIRTEKTLYDAIWMACEHTANYFERNLRKVFASANWNELHYSDLSHFDKNKFLASDGAEGTSDKENNGLSISEIADNLAMQISLDRSVDDAVDDFDFDAETVYCRSIVSFDLLLIHALRIFYAKRGLADIQPRLKAGNVLAIFDSLLRKGETEIKDFIKLLWQVRYQFDTWVVKWIEHDDSKEEQLRLTSQSRSMSDKNNYINRTVRELSSLTQLQAVRNFTGERSAQYWLTPFLAKLIDEPGSSEPEVLALLEAIDNQLSLSKETQKNASFTQAKGFVPDQINWSEQVLYFSKTKGTSFEHYWFQKLEYLLWKQEVVRSAEKFRKYRISSKNSVEHVHPQNEEHGRRLASTYLDAFGNLVLLSPSENSSYSNQAVIKKKADFDSKLHYDSLKLKHMFELMGQGEWEVAQILEHQAVMVKVLSSHYSLELQGLH